MKCPHCHKKIEIENDAKNRIDSTYILIANIMIWLVPYAFILNLLDDFTSLPISMSDGLAANYWMIPMIVIGIGMMVYCLLYEHGKVKGKFLYKGAR